MMTAMLTVENIKQGKRVFDVWQVNQDAEYHEDGEARSDVASGASAPGTERLVPQRV
jgi:hypothetical protein